MSTILTQVGESGRVATFSIIYRNTAQVRPAYDNPAYVVTYHSTAARYREQYRQMRYEGYSASQARRVIWELMHDHGTQFFVVPGPLD